jgi:hypothetical protein
VAAALHRVGFNFVVAWLVRGPGDLPAVNHVSFMDFPDGHLEKSKMRKLLTIALAILATLSVAACAGKAPIGKGKAPIVTRG